MAVLLLTWVIRIQKLTWYVIMTMISVRNVHYYSSIENNSTKNYKYLEFSEICGFNLGASPTSSGSHYLARWSPARSIG